MAIQLQIGESRLVRIVQAIIELVKGRAYNCGTVTLSAGATSTVVAFENCSPNCTVVLSPMTADAAAAIATTYVAASNIVAGQFTITHANAASVDRTFGFACVGG